MQNIIKYLPGYIFGKDKKQVTSQTEAWKQEAECGCGINCCTKEFVNRDKVTDSPYHLYVEDGVFILEIEGSKYSVDLTAL